MHRLGEGAGLGYNINVPWDAFGVGDAENIKLFAEILMPIAEQFKPDLGMMLRSGPGGCRYGGINGRCGRRATEA